MNAPKPNYLQTTEETVLELIVNNHPGVMSHVCGLFSRRAYNLEGITVLPIGDGKKSRIWLKVNEHERLGQIVKQLEKREDIKRVSKHSSAHSIFSVIEPYFTE